ncbi:MAG: hypothetical protein ABIT20_01975 [Gemmatimonadaceae bacterium]
MRSKFNQGLVALVLAVAGTVLLQGCASVTTGQFVPSRSTNTNRTMTSNYDQLSHQLKTPSTGSRFRIVSSSGGGVYDYRYY